MQVQFTLNVTSNLTKLMKSLLVSDWPHFYLHVCGLIWVCSNCFVLKLSFNWFYFNFVEFLFQAHNRNLLSIDFDQSTRVGKIYDDHRKFTLHIQYDSLGRPVVWSPSSKYTEVNISYSAGGLLSAIYRGDWSERLEYENDRVVSRAWVNGKIWSYTYADRVRGFCVERGCDSFCLRFVWRLASAVSKKSNTSFLLCLLLQGYQSCLIPEALRDVVKACETNYEMKATD